MKTSDFDFDLPPEYIAQVPIESRDASRLLVLNRNSGGLEHTHFHDLGSYLEPGDVLVVNETRVIPARLYGRKIPTGGRVEILLLNRQDETTWETLVGAKGMTAGKRIQLENGPGAEVITQLDGPQRLIQFDKPIEP